MPLNIGEIAPDIMGTDVVNNQPWSLADHANKTVLLAFSGITWCSYCESEAPELETVWQKLQGNPSFTMAIISGHFEEEEDSQALQQAIDHFGITFPVVPGASYWSAYNVKSVPLLYCLNWNEESNKHEVCNFHSGSSTAEEILDFLYSCGLTTQNTIKIETNNHWTAVLIALFGGADAGGGGIGITAGGKPVPIPPRDVMQSLGDAGRDVLTGLAVAEMAGHIRDPDSKRLIRLDGLHTAQAALKQLEKQHSVSKRVKRTCLEHGNGKRDVADKKKS